VPRTCHSGCLDHNPQVTYTPRRYALRRSRKQAVGADSADVLCLVCCGSCVVRVLQSHPARCLYLLICFLNSLFKTPSTTSGLFCDLNKQIMSNKASAGPVLITQGLTPSHFRLPFVPIWSYGIAFTWPFLDVPPFFCSRRVRSAGPEAPLISRDIKLCAQKAEPGISRESLADRGRGPRSLSGALTGRTAGKNSGRLELTDWR
jgi:hypothetical protein